MHITESSDKKISITVPPYIPFLSANRAERAGPKAILIIVRIILNEFSESAADPSKSPKADVYPARYAKVRDKDMRKKKTESFMRFFLLCLVPSRKISTVILGGVFTIMREEITMDIKETTTDNAGFTVKKYAAAQARIIPILIIEPMDLALSKKNQPIIAFGGSMKINPPEQKPSKI